MTGRRRTRAVARQAAGKQGAKAVGGRAAVRGEALAAAAVRPRDAGLVARRVAQDEEEAAVVEGGVAAGRGRRRSCGSCRRK